MDWRTAADLDRWLTKEGPDYNDDDDVDDDVDDDDGSRCPMCGEVWADCDCEDDFRDDEEDDDGADEYDDDDESDGTTNK